MRLSTRHSALSFALTALLAGTSACTGSVSGAEPDGASPESAEPGVGPGPEAGSPESGSPEAYDSIYVGVNDDGSNICGGDLAEDTFRYGLCVCNDLDMAGSLRTASVNAGAPDLVAGGVGINGDYSLAGASTIDGSLIVGGRFNPVGQQRIGSELRVGGDVAAVGSITIAGDAFLAGDVSAIGLDIGGTLYTQQEQSMFFIDAEDTEVLSFDIPPPCSCESADDVETFVADASTDNDNEALDIESDMLDRRAGDFTLDVGPGRVYLTAIDLAGVLTFRVTGPTAVYIAGDMQAAGLIDVEFASDDAELNLFLDGSIRTAGQLELGTDEDPSRVRVYMSGNGDIRLAGGLAIRGGLSAPNSVLSTAGDVILEGAILVGTIESAGVVSVNYDTGFIDTDSGCDDTPGEPEPAPEAQPEPAPEAQPEPAPEAQPEPTPEAQPEPAPEQDTDRTCVNSLDCPSPEVCLDGVCTYVAL